MKIRLCHSCSISLSLLLEHLFSLLACCSLLFACSSFPFTRWKVSIQLVVLSVLFACSSLSYPGCLFLSCQLLITFLFLVRYFFVSCLLLFACCLLLFTPCFVLLLLVIIVLQKYDKGTGYKQKLMSNKQELTSNKQTAKSNQPQITSNEPKVLSGEQRVLTNEQKGEKKARTNE